MGPRRCAIRRPDGADGKANDERTWRGPSWSCPLKGAPLGGPWLRWYQGRQRHRMSEAAGVRTATDDELAKWLFSIRSGRASWRAECHCRLGGSLALPESRKVV